MLTKLLEDPDFGLENSCGRARADLRKSLACCVLKVTIFEKGPCCLGRPF
jgi:hypothetical protein